MFLVKYCTKVCLSSGVKKEVVRQRKSGGTKKEGGDVSTKEREISRDRVTEVSKKLQKRS